VTAGTSDLPVAREAFRTLGFYGVGAREIADVGVAGLWRILQHEQELKRYPVVIVVAGMEGALFSVVAGLVGGVVIAVPTSTGYGVARAGETALHAALASCAPGLVTVNIDNGYGAASAALRVLATRGHRAGAAAESGLASGAGH
jgi:NCAIR mutase (PurE)-related protein